MPLKMLRRYVLGLALSLPTLGLPVATTAVLAADPSYPPAASIGLVVPAGMTASKTFAGFEHRSGASIVITEMPAEAYPQIIAGFTPERLRQSGFIANRESEPLTVIGGEGQILRGSQKANGLTYAKWVAIVNGSGGTGLVTVQVPQTADKELPAETIESALRTISFRAPASLQDQIASLPYKIGDMGGFRPVRVIAGSSLLLTKGPKDVDPDGTQPIVVVASSMGQASIGNGQESAFARKAFGTLAGLKDIAVTDETKPADGASRAVKLRGTAKHSNSDRPMSVTQTVLFNDRGYLRIIGIAPATEADAAAESERIAASIDFR